MRIRTFEPRATLTDEQLAAENLTELWGSPEKIATYVGGDVFGPRSLASLLNDLLKNNLSAQPLDDGR